MANVKSSRRQFIKQTGQAMAAGGLVSSCAHNSTHSGATEKKRHGQGDQRLSLKALHQWEALGYGMFIHYGMSTFVEKEIPDGKHPPKTYAPTDLDVDQWVSVARDAGMRYAVLTAKHVAGHCLWPSKYTDYSVANSSDTTDVLEKFVDACGRRGVLPAFYYCSWDNHHLFGSHPPGIAKWQQAMYTYPKDRDPGDNESMPAFTSSMYQNFQTDQVTELITEYGPFAEVWIDIPCILGRGYRTFLYEHIAKLQPDAVIMMNSGISSGEEYDITAAWPSDLIAIERRMPPGQGHNQWRSIEGGEYYMPGEVCDPIGKDWFYVPDDYPRADAELAEQLGACRERKVNLLLDVPPDKTGKIPEFHVKALQRLRKNAGL